MSCDRLETEMILITITFATFCLFHVNIFKGLVILSQMLSNESQNQIWRGCIIKFRKVVILRRQGVRNHAFIQRLLPLFAENWVFKHSDTYRRPCSERGGKIFKIDTSILLQIAFLGLTKASVICVREIVFRRLSLKLNPKIEFWIPSNGSQLVAAWTLDNVVCCLFVSTIFFH